MVDFGSSREFIVEGNKIIIKIGGTTDIYTDKAPPDREYVLDLEGEEVFGSTYISAQAYMEAIEEYSRMRVTEGMLGSIQTEDVLFPIMRLKTPSAPLQ